jgi:hypothetical protein
MRVPFLLMWMVLAGTAGCGRIGYPARPGDGAPDDGGVAENQRDAAVRAGDAGPGGSGGNDGAVAAGWTDCSLQSCQCSAGQTCWFRCTTGLCSARCLAGSTCHVDCAGGACTMNCDENATCSYCCSGAFSCGAHCNGPCPEDCTQAP